MKIDLIVTRHPGLVTYLIEEGLVKSDVIVIDHADPAQISGKNVCGVLPHSLSCLCASFTEVPLFIPAELRGKELTVEQVRKHAQPIVTYKITKI